MLMTFLRPNPTLLAALALSVMVDIPSGHAETQAPAAAPRPSASTDFLSDDQFQRLPADERRRLLRGAWLARIEPTAQPDIARAPLYIERIKWAVTYDPRLTVFDLKAEPVPSTTDALRISGEALLESYVHGVADTLGQMGYRASTETVRILPDPGLAAGGAYAVVVRPGGAAMRRHPRNRAEQVNEVPLGGALRLLRAGRPQDIPEEAQDGGRPAGRGPGRADATEPDTPPGEWFLAQSTEGYVGYVRAADIARTPALVLPKALLTAPTTATLSADHPTSPGQPIRLAAGTLLVPAEMRHWQAPHAPIDPIQPGSPVRILSDQAATADQLRALLEPFVGQPYEWGGTSSDGIDCSGLTQFVLRALGAHLPRDAEEQAIVGKIVAWGDDVIQAAQPGDLVFFTNARGRVSHVAVSLGDGLIAHAHERSVKIEPLREVLDRSGESLADRILFARRVLAR